MQRYEKNQLEIPKVKTVLDGKTRQFKHQTLDCEDLSFFFFFLMLVTQLCPTL